MTCTARITGPGRPNLCKGHYRWISVDVPGCKDLLAAITCYPLHIDVSSLREQAAGLS